MTAAERQRKYRRRCRDGAVVLRPAVPLYPLVEALIQTKRISEQAALDRSEIDKAAAQLLIDFAERWARPQT